MIIFPKIGSSRWILFQRRAYVDAVEAKVIDIDQATGNVTFRWKEPGLEMTVKRKPGGFWKTKEDADKALLRLGRHRDWREYSGDQLRFFKKEGG